jgi:hypothetical protein
MQQLHLFKGKNQRGVKLPPAPEFNLHVMVADTLQRWGTRGWRYTHIPSGEWRHPITAMRLKRMGTMRGWSDFILLSPRPSRTHFLELKRKRGKLSEHQLEFQTWCYDNGVEYAVCDDYRTALDKLRDWGAVRATVTA